MASYFQRSSLRTGPQYPETRLYHTACIMMLEIKPADLKLQSSQ
jgi:hypothetical protein